MQRTKEPLIYLTLIAIVVGVAVVGFYLPQFKEVSALKTEIQQRRDDIDAQSNKVALVPVLKGQIEAMKNRYSDFDQKLPKQKELGGFLREITKLLSDKNLSNQLIEPASPTQHDLFHTLPIKMRFKGSYIATAQFLKEIEQMQRLTRIEKLIIHSPRKSEGDLNIELKLNIYFTQS